MTSGRDGGDSPYSIQKQHGIGQESCEGQGQSEDDNLHLEGQGQEPAETLQNGGDIVEESKPPVIHLPPKPKLRPKPRVRSGTKKPIFGTEHEVNHEGQMTENQGQGHLSADATDQQMAGDDKENHEVVTSCATKASVADEPEITMATSEIIKPRAETPIVQGVVGPKILAKANMNSRKHALQEDEEAELKHELEVISENRIHRADSKKNSRVARVNLSSRVEVMLSNELFKKYLQKNEDIMEKLAQKQGRTTPGGGIKKALSNLDLRNIDLEEELTDPLSSSQNGDFFSFMGKKCNDEGGRRSADAETLRNSKVPDSSPGRHRRHVSLGNSNELQDLEDELTKRQCQQEVKAISKQGQTRSKFLVPSFQDFKKSRQNKLLSGHNYVKKVMSMSKGEDNDERFTARESANLDYVTSLPPTESKLSPRTDAQGFDSEIENITRPVRSRSKHDKSAISKGQGSDLDSLSDQQPLVQTGSMNVAVSRSSPDSSHTSSEKCNNDTETQSTDQGYVQSGDTSERDCGLIPEIKNLPNNSTNLIETKDQENSANVSGLPPKVSNETGKHRVILRASRKRRMPQPAPRTSLGQRPHSVNIISSKAQPVLTKSQSLDVDNHVSVNISSQIENSRERTQSTDSEVSVFEPKPLKRTDGIVLYPNDKTSENLGINLISFSNMEKSPCDDGTFYFPDSPFCLETPKNFTFSPRDSPSLVSDKNSTDMFEFPEPVTDTQEVGNDNDSVSSQDKGSNSIVDSDESEASKRLSWITSSLDNIFSICENVIDDVKPEERVTGNEEQEGEVVEENIKSEEIDETEDVFIESPISENAKNFVFRSSSDVSDSTPQALRKRRERKERPYKSDPFTGAVRLPVGRFPHMPGKLQHSSSGRDDGFPDDCSLEEVDELEEVTWDEMEAEKKRRLRYRLSNISDASTDSGVIGQEGSQEAPPSPSSGSSYSCSGSVRSTGGDNLDTKENRPQEADGDVTSSPTKSHKKIHERKETILEIQDTEIGYGRDLMILKEHFYKPMKTTGLLTGEQVDSVFLNLEELISNNAQFTSRINTAIQTAITQGDLELNSLSVGQLFMNSTDLLMAFENYCINQGQAAILLESLEREKELLRIFLQVSQDENSVLRRMPLKSFLILPVQRIMRYPLLLERLYKGTSKENPDKAAILEARTKIEDILSRINSKTKRGGTIKSKRRGADMLLKQIASTEKSEFNRVAVEILGWNRKDVCEIMTSRLQVAFVTEQNWAIKRLKNLKFSTVHGILITLGQGEVIQDEEDVLLFPSKRPVIQAAIVLIKEKNGKYTTVRDPFILNRCIVNHEPDVEDIFELVELNKDVVVFKGEDSRETKLWLKNVKQQTIDLGTWRRRRNALPNIMIKHIV